jgi:hypothetical protein
MELVDRAIGDLTLIMFNNLLHINKYMVKERVHKTKQTCNSNLRTSPPSKRMLHCAQSTQLSPMMRSSISNHHGQWGNTEIGKPKECGK